MEDLFGAALRRVSGMLREHGADVDARRRRAAARRPLRLRALAAHRREPARERGEVLARRRGDRAQRAERDGDEVRIAVADRGPGVPEGEEERIFEPFYRPGESSTAAAPASASRSRGGWPRRRAARSATSLATGAAASSSCACRRPSTASPAKGRAHLCEIFVSPARLLCAVFAAWAVACSVRAFPRRRRPDRSRMTDRASDFRPASPIGDDVPLSSDRPRRGHGATRSSPLHPRRRRRRIRITRRLSSPDRPPARHPHAHRARRGVRRHRHEPPLHGEGSVRRRARPRADASSNVYGILSLVFWSIMLVVVVKYLVFILRADNQGEGGVLALLALVLQRQHRSERPGGGASCSSSSACSAPRCSSATASSRRRSRCSARWRAGDRRRRRSRTSSSRSRSAILLLLFMVQRFGTAKVGRAFGPITLIWFLVIGVLGLREIAARAAHPRGDQPVVRARASSPTTAPSASPPRRGVPRR